MTAPVSQELAAAAAVEGQLKPWQRPPFEPGHTLSVRHGIHSARLYEPIAQQLWDYYESQRPDVAQKYEGALAALCRDEARILMLDEYLQKHGIADAAGKLRDDALRHLRGFGKDAAARRADLGLTPMSEARLLATRAEAATGVASAQAVKERADRARQARAQRVDATAMPAET